MKAHRDKGRTNTRLLLAAGFGVPALLICAIPIIYNLAPAPATLAPAASGAAAKVAQNPPSVPASTPTAPALDQAGLDAFHQTIQPILQEHCYECHGNGESNGGVAFDKLATDDQILKNPDLWLKVIKYTRAGVMPADGNPRLPDKDQATLDNWIKFHAFGQDPKTPDPGRVTVHKLNRFEYHNTIRDLLGVDFDANAAFPNDDINYGFDNIADALTVSPILMEKYLNAAQTIVEQAVPSTSRVMPEIIVSGKDFADDTGRTGVAKTMSYFAESAVSYTLPIAVEGDYKLVFEQGVNSDFTYTPANCSVLFYVDGEKQYEYALPWKGVNSGGEIYPSWYDGFRIHLNAGDHQIKVMTEPIDGAGAGKISYDMRSLKIDGPADPSKWVHPANYERVFTKDEAPTDPAARRAYARDLLGPFATKAFRRPVPADTLDKLVNIAEKVYNVPGKTFEMGVSQAMVAVLASPRFLFRVESPESPATGQSPSFAEVDEYSLASRLSYLLWSSMPDDELFKLAAAGQLRKNLDAQVQRMMADPRSDAFIQNFSGEWLQTSGVLNISLSPAEILARQGITANPVLTDALRAMFKQEADAYFNYVVRENRSVNEFVDSNYTFLNQTLAEFYGFKSTDPATGAPVYSGLDESTPEVTGPEMRKVNLAADHWYGGVLTMGSVMMITSNPTRTSPVKRGKWILDNILGVPVPPPPPNIPALESSAQKVGDRDPTLRETLAAHRASPLCASCHDRMDPLGLALENFSALGQLRNQDMAQPIDASGKLSSGESFKDIRDIKHMLLTDNRDDFYRCLTEKLLTYALGRGLEYYDVPTVDNIVQSLESKNGQFSGLLMGVIDSAAFQEERVLPPQQPAAPKVASISIQNTNHP